MNARYTGISRTRRAVTLALSLPGRVLLRGCWLLADTADRVWMWWWYR